MKLCSICDKKIEGTWCKNCHRFVKTYDLPEGIHFNESHNPANDANCTYHVDVRKSGNTTQSTVNRGTGTTSSRQTYTQTTTRTQNSTGTGSTASGKSTGKKKKGKLVVILIVLYILFNIIGGLIPVITNCVGALSDELKESIREDFDVDDPFAETPEQVDAEYEEKLAAIEKLTPTDEFAEDDFVFYYYDPRDIVPLGFECDESHFDVTVPEFDEWLADAWVDDYEVEDDISEYYNYYYEDGVETWLSFSLYRDYYADDELAVRVDYDTATQKLHMFGFVAAEGVDATALYYEALKEFDPDTDWTQKFFKQKLNEAFEAEGEEYETVTVYSSDALIIGAQVRDGYNSVTFYSVYE